MNLKQPKNNWVAFVNGEIKKISGKAMDRNRVDDEFGWYMRHRKDSKK